MCCLKILKVIMIILTIIVIIFLFVFLYLLQGLKDGENVAINSIDTATLADGVYSGQYQGGRWSNQLNVTVENHRITAIEITDDITFAQKDVSDELFDRVIAEHNTTVDAVSGATVTSKAYLKAIENACNQ